jgi:uncharacterized membrane protein YbhN (UPF0104 family)
MKRFSTLIKVLVSAALIVILALNTDIKKIAAVVSVFELPYIIPILLLIAAAVLISAFKWQVLLKAQGLKIRVAKLFRYYTAGFFFNNFLPSSIGCDGVRVMLLKNDIAEDAARQDASFFAAGMSGPAVYAASAASVVAERILAMFTLGLLGLAGALFAHSPPRIAVVTLSSVCASGLLILTVQLTGFIPKSISAKNTKLASVWKGFAFSSAELRRKPVSILICLAESLLFQILVAFTQEAIILGLGLPFLPLGDLFFVSAAASVLAMVPLGVNGYGFREGGFIFLLEPLGYDGSGAFAVSLLFALFVSLYSLLGAYFWVKAKKRSGDTASADAPLLAQADRGAAGNSIHG